MKAIRITLRGYDLILDEDELWRINKYSYHPYKNTNGAIYFYRISGNKNIRIYREIMNTPKGMTVDHINNNTLDCRKINMRNCTQGENDRNRRKGKLNKSGFKGVYLNKRNNKWIAKIKLCGKNYYLGTFINPVEAHKAYCKGAIKYHGEYANFG